MGAHHSTHSPTQHDEHSPEEIKKTLWKYWAVFIALFVFTVITVAVSYIDLGKPGNITLALIIATFKATLVGLFFMHLIAEKKTIYTFMAFTLIFFLGLVFLCLLAWWDPIVHH
jgi:cytochrome c oxidase subunit 4